eukprot:m.128789 g.128789  ORF g.128789 m.128789 type:complete len:477 (+) comp16395_c0_seq4:436-1866(+)
MASGGSRSNESAFAAMMGGGKRGAGGQAAALARYFPSFDTSDDMNAGYMQSDSDDDGVGLKPFTLDDNLRFSSDEEAEVNEILAQHQAKRGLSAAGGARRSDSNANSSSNSRETISSASIPPAPSSSSAAAGRGATARQSALAQGLDQQGDRLRQASSAAAATTARMDTTDLSTELDCELNSRFDQIRQNMLAGSAGGASAAAGGNGPSARRSQPPPGFTGQPKAATASAATDESSKKASAKAGVDPTRLVPRGHNIDDPDKYDNLYFDSDEDNNDAADSGVRLPGGKKDKRVLSNDELLYDPKMDDDDNDWVTNQRQFYRTGKKSSDKLPDRNADDMRRAAQENADKGLKAVPQSDAVLNCPACFATVCLDCQQHEEYESQFRAMFVLNCRINRGETLRYSEKKKNKKSSKKRGKGRGAAAGDAMEEDDAPAGMTPVQEGGDVYNPVHCALCNTVVAVYDVDEIYHFFNVLAAEA